MKTIRKAAKKLSALLPKSELLIIPGVGHEVNKYAPEAIAAILNRG
jgi:pimeloyl-ACP methyl ester carboxylesterase